MVAGRLYYDYESNSMKRICNKDNLKLLHDVVHVRVLLKINNTPCKVEQSLRHIIIETLIISSYFITNYNHFNEVFTTGVNRSCGKPARQYGHQ